MKIRNTSHREAFIHAYLVCALWSTHDDDGDPLDGTYSIDDIAPNTLAVLRDDCLSFMTECEDLLKPLEPGKAGHDFWLTRNHHGAGYWDRYGHGHPHHENGEKLMQMAHAWPAQDLYVGDDGKLYI